MKIALCFGGHLRTYDRCLNSPYLKKFINKYDADIYVSTWEDMYPSSSCYRTDPTLNGKVNMDDVRVKFNTEHVKIYENLEFNSPNLNVFDSLNYGKYSDYLSMHFMINQSLKYAAVTEDYDIIVRIRPDLYLLSELEIFEKTVFPCASFFPDFSPYKYGFTDTFYYGKPDDVLKISNFYEVASSNVTNEHYPNYHESIFSKYILSLNMKIEFDQSILYQIYRPNNERNTLGFYDINGNLKIPSVK